MTSDTLLPIITRFPQYPAYTILITLFENVLNSKDIRSQLLAGNSEYEYAFIDPSTVCFFFFAKFEFSLFFFFFFSL